jgi:hypothetical protein
VSATAICTVANSRLFSIDFQNSGSVSTSWKLRQPAAVAPEKDKSTFSRLVCPRKTKA